MHIFHQVIKCFRLLYRLFFPGTLPLVILKFFNVLQGCQICQNARYYSVIYLVSRVKDDLVDVRLLRQLLVLIVVKIFRSVNHFAHHHFQIKRPCTQLMVILTCLNHGRSYDHRLCCINPHQVPYSRSRT